MSRGILYLVLFLLLALPLATAGAQGPVAGERTPSPERLPPGGKMPRPEGQPEWGEDAHPTSSLWQIETVDSAGNVGYDPSIALDTAGRPHISYFDQSNGDLKYAYLDGSGWQIQTVDSGGFVGFDTDLVLDAAGRPHICYFDYDNLALKYTYYDGSIWHFQVVDNNSLGPFGAYASLKLDAADRPHISYCTWSGGSCKELKYTYYDGGIWHTETVDSGWVGRWTSLVLNAAGHPCISYYAESSADLKYACHDGSAWHIEVVDSTGTVGWFGSLALDNAGNPGISYYEGYPNYNLKYAHRDGMAWQIATLYHVGDFQGSAATALALDTTTGYPHITFYDANNTDLRHTYFDGAVWHLETVDGDGYDVGCYSSLALDSAGRPHISYYDRTNGDLKYARKTGWDSGFRPNLHGYSFPNYGGLFPLPPIDFTADDVVRMFGAEAACAIQWPVCVLKRPAVIWAWNANWAMNGGHCDGFTTTGLRFFKGLDNPADFQAGASMAHDLLLENVRRHIAYYWVLQIPSPVAAARSQALQKTPSEVLEQVRSTIAGGFADPTTLIMYNPARTSGHSVTPYLVEDRGSGIYWIWVYDNNHPDDANRHVEVNTTANTWSYDLGGSIGTWSGDANSHSLGAISISTYALPPQCPWCGGAGIQGGTQLEQTWLSGGGHLLITDSLGRRIGYVGDQFMNEVPGAFGTALPGGLGLPVEPIYYLPITDTYTILLDSQTLTRTDTVAVTQFGPGYAVSVKDVAVEAATRDILTFAPDGTELAYRSSGDKETTLILALDRISQSVQFQVGHADIGANQVVTLTADMSTGRLAFNNVSNGGGEYDLEIWRVGATGQQWFVHAGLIISATDTHYVDYGAWDGSGPMPLYVDHGSDGTIDETWAVDNQVRHIYLPLMVKGL